MKDLLEEPEALRVAELLGEIPRPATSRISYVECSAALSRARREQRIGPREERSGTANFDGLWSHLTIVELDDDLARGAARLAAVHALRAGDAIHLGSALAIQRPGEECRFASWDRRLWDAAAAAGFAMVPESRP